MLYSYDKNFKGIVATPNSAQEWLELVCDIAIDYDGYTDSKNLMELIDEMKEYVVKAQICLQNGEIFEDKFKTTASLIKARLERNKDKKNSLTEYEQEVYKRLKENNCSEEEIEKLLKEL